MLYLLDLFGVAVFAITGSLRVREKKLDLLGVLIIALVTALGGGTTRDVLLDIRPIFWITDMSYIVVAVLAALFTFATARWVAFPHRFLLICDALGLSVAAILGVQVSLAHGAPLLIAIMMGMVSGTVGGVIRDILSNEIPLIFGNELYATAALGGSAVFVVAQEMGASEPFTLAAGIGTVLALRLFALRFKIRLPEFEAQPPR
jgi:uncharacterized membrane protein YeiH